MGGARQAENRVHQIRIDQGKNAVASSNVSLEDRERVIAAFKKAREPANEKDRRRTMEERIQSVITQGGAGTVTIDEAGPSSPHDSKAPSNTHKGAEKLIPDATEVVTSPPDWGEAEETAFEKQLEEAKAASLAQAQSNAERGQPSTEDPKVDEEFEKELRLAMELSLAEQRGYERGLLQAAAKWREDIPHNTGQ